MRGDSQQSSTWWGCDGLDDAGGGAAQPLAPGKRWHFFISHFQRNAEGIASTLHLLLNARGYRCWRDQWQNPTVDGMVDGVARSECVLLLLTKDVMTRPFCRFELRVARALGDATLCVHEPEPDKLCTYSTFGEHCAAAPADLSALFAEQASMPYRRMRPRSPP